MAIVGLVAGVAILGCTLRTEHVIDARIRLEIHHIEDQADSALDFISGETDEVPDIKIDEKKEDNGAWLLPALDALAPFRTAYAQPTSGSDEAKKHLLRMRERYPKLMEQKEAGYVGENNRGYVQVLDHEGLEADDELKNEVQRLVAAENENRKDYYREIVKANEEIKSLATVERAYALAYFKRGKSGQWFETPPEGDALEAYKHTAQGKKLGDELKPETWVQMP
jgi:uncharacterized protein YdbL (DUF1318 family)